jgi:hypothetical protein
MSHADDEFRAGRLIAHYRLEEKLEYARLK